MARVHSNVGHRNVRTLTLDGFRGVDFTSSALDVDKRRATSMKNLLPEAGRNVKRRGWVQEFRAPGQVHGMWSFIHGDSNTLLVHAGMGLYESYRENGVDKWRAVQGCTELLSDEDGEAFLFNGRMYLVGHKSFLVYGSWDGGETYALREVEENEDTYIPTTTIAINPDGDTDGVGNVKDTRVSWEPVNRLTSKRKNRLMGKALGEAPSITWRLDSDVTLSWETLEDITVQVSALVKGVEKTYELVVDKTSFDDVAADYCNLRFVGDSVPEGFETGKIAGSLFSWGQLTLMFDTTPPLEGEDNITVTFTKKVEDHAESIGKCRFGVLYGAGGNADRLFLSGNPDTPAVEYYSYWRDPTYFPDVYYNRVGSDYTDIVGFARVSDGVLAVFKETDRQEPTVYYHTATDEVIYNQNDQLERVDFLLTTQAGNIGEGMISRRASVDFFGDPLILSENGVFGIVMRQNLMTADRYAVERSRNIREKMRGVDKSRAVGVVYENQYWLFMGGACFVADEGYTFRPKESASGYQYEWWYLENIPAVSASVSGDTLWFGTEDGRICRFKRREEMGRDLFTDVTWDYHAPNKEADVAHQVEVMTVKDEDFSRIVASDAWISALGTASMDSLIPDSEMYALYLSAEDYTVSDGRLILNDPWRINDIRDGEIVYADTVGTSGLEVGVPYQIGHIDLGEGSLALERDGALVNTTKGGFRLCLPLCGREVFISDANVDDGSFSLVLFEGGEALEITTYNGAPISISGKHVVRDTVEAEWYSPIMDLSTAGYGKTLERLTVTLEPSASGAVLVGYETRTVNRLFGVHGLCGMDFGNLDFRSFTFSAFAGSQTVILRERNVNYICFRAVSGEPHDMRLHAISAEYKITTANRGLV